MCVFTLTYMCCTFYIHSNSMILCEFSKHPYFLLYQPPSLSYDYLAFILRTTMVPVSPVV